jgi:chemotaxis protein CheC
MDLTLTQKDALTELINIGYGRAAGALSELTGYRIQLEVPQVNMHAIDEIAPMLAEVMQGEVASVNQIFTGPIAGNALLLLDEKAALVLSRLLSDDRAQVREFDASAREIVTEVGNILLNACLGVFGNLLHVHVSFAVPRLHVETVQHVLESVTLESAEKLRYGLMIHTRFRLRGSDVVGYLVIILGITSLDRLLRELERWENRQAT